MILTSSKVTLSNMKHNKHSNSNKTLLFHTLLIPSLLLIRVKPDPVPIHDYCVADTGSSTPIFLNGQPCIDPVLATSAHFATSLSNPTNLRPINLFGFNVSLTDINNLPGLNTLGLTMAQYDLEGNGLVGPHSHPRASEVVICVKGSLLVGFIDTSNRIFEQTIKPGESFVFPKGLVHFVFNTDIVGPAKTLSGLNSQNPGTQGTSLASFTTNPKIPDIVLNKAFQILDSDLAKIRKRLGG